MIPLFWPKIRIPDPKNVAKSNLRIPLKFADRDSVAYDPRYRGIMIPYPGAEISDPIYLVTTLITYKD